MTLYIDHGLWRHIEIFLATTFCLIGKIPHELVARAEGLGLARTQLCGMNTVVLIGWA